MPDGTALCDATGSEYGSRRMLVAVLRNSDRGKRRRLDEWCCAPWPGCMAAGAQPPMVDGHDGHDRHPMSLSGAIPTLLK